MTKRKTYPFDPNWVMSPGVILQDILNESGLPDGFGIRFIAKLSQLDPEVIQGILAGKTEITKDIAQRLAAGVAPLSLSAQFWLNLEGTYRRGLEAGKVDLSKDYM